MQHGDDWPVVEVAAEGGVINGEHLHCPLHPVKGGALPHELGGPPHGGGGGGGRAELDRDLLRGVGQLDYMPDAGVWAILQPGTPVTQPYLITCVLPLFEFLPQ